jgi:hypothetical protein
LPRQEVQLERSRGFLIYTVGSDESLTYGFTSASSAFAVRFRPRSAQLGDELDAAGREGERHRVLEEQPAEPPDSGTLELIVLRRVDSPVERSRSHPRRRVGASRGKKVINTTWANHGFDLKRTCWASIELDTVLGLMER